MWFQKAPGCCSHVHQSEQHYHIYQQEPVKEKRYNTILLEHKSEKEIS